VTTSRSQQEHKTGKANRLIEETSTYLLQHAYNPVDWYAWGPDALERAKKEDKPILLSVGYAACHWCHVMEHESFEDEETAAVMNKLFVNIKVDREERTDIDEIYMKAVQLMTGHGGWPMTVFLTPELKPFFGGTYFPKEDKHGLPAFRRLLMAINEAWNTKRDEIEESSADLVGHLQSFDSIAASLGKGEIEYSVIDDAIGKLLEHSDSRWGGFGGAPKFPHSFSIDLLMRGATADYKGRDRKRECLDLVTITLDCMAYGGIHDQLGGGFARYSVDRQWLIPHFEKMLYDNALLCQTYLNGSLLTGRTYWAAVARGIMDFVCRELRTEDGGFYSSLDADSEGHEGKFYVWTRDEIMDELGKVDGEFFCNVYGATAQGNFEHETNALHLPASPEETARKYKLSVDELWSKLQPMKETMLKKRAGRIRPGRDEKVLTSWNSLMISAFVDGYRILKEPKYLQAAQDCANFILKNLVKGDRLLRTWGQGKSKIDGYLDDYAFFAQALLDLASVDPNPIWFDKAFGYAKTMMDLFWDEETGGFFYTSTEHEALVTRPRSLYDGSIPSGLSVGTSVLLRLCRLSGDSQFDGKLESIFKTYAPLMMRVPDQFANLLCAMELKLSNGPEVVLVSAGDKDATFEPMLFALNQRFSPNKVVFIWRAGEALGDRKALTSLLEGRKIVDGKTTAYVCQNFTCDAPINNPKKLSEKF